MGLNGDQKDVRVDVVIWCLMKAAFQIARERMVYSINSIEAIGYPFGKQKNLNPFLTPFKSEITDTLKAEDVK